MMRTLITGGAGFLGSHLCERFLAEGHHVVCLDDLSTGSEDNIAHLLGHPEFRFIQHDITQGTELEGPLDYVLHFASPASPIDYLRAPIETLRVGSAGTYNVLELARAKRARFLLASTSEVYGDPLQHPQSESYWGNVNSCGPRSVYDEAKRFGEAMTMAYQRHYGLETRIVRIFNTYGERMQLDDGRAIPAFMSQALRGEPLSVFGAGSQTRSLCYVSDLVEGIYRLLLCDYSGPVNIGNPDEITMIALAQEILSMVPNSTSYIVFLPLPQDDPQMRRPNITLAKQLLGWEPTVPRHLGFDRTLAYFSSHISRGDSAVASAA